MIPSAFCITTNVVKSILYVSSNLFLHCLASCRPQNLVVKTNLFQVEYSGDPLSTWIQYKMEIVLLKGTKYADKETWKEAGDAHPERISRMQARVEKFGSTELTRKICQLLSQQIQREYNSLLVVSTICVCDHVSR